MLESPPAGGGYFYDPLGRVSEVLFRSFMQTLFGKKFTTKHEGLIIFQHAGYMIINAIYAPVNKLTDKEADRRILDNYINLKKELRRYCKPETTIILVKANICKLLESKLLADGFPIANKGRIIPFPLHYHFPDFKGKIRKILPKSR